MADLLGRLSAGGADIHYLSASPWQLYEPLSGFLRDHGFPRGPMTLRSFRLKDRTALNMLEDPGPYKREAMQTVLNDFPDRRFVLIGDSTEDDAEVFAGAARNDQRIIYIAIRAVPEDDAGEQRARDALSALADHRSTIFTDPDSVPAEQIMINAMINQRSVSPLDGG
jgi:phosphatidate phosphatase APP1